MEYYIDPILAECRQRKAELLEEYGGWEGYCKRQREETLRPDGKPWPMAKPEDLAALKARNKPPTIP
jgi:hypothetical protein